MKPYQKSIRKLKKFAETLDAGSFDANKFALIIYKDGGIVLWPSAFTKEDDDYIWVFSEHCGNLLLAKNDLVRYATLIETKDDNASS